MLNENYYQGIASDLSDQGRYGDSMLMHVNPAEVQGLAAAFPGNVTRNPQTGLPEAFAFAPILMSMALAGGMNLATGSKTPIWKSILMGALGGVLSPVIASGLGSVFGAGASEVGTQVAASGLDTVAPTVLGTAGEAAVPTLLAQNTASVASPNLMTGGLGLSSADQVLAQQAVDPTNLMTGDLNLLSAEQITAGVGAPNLAPSVTNMFGEPGTNSEMFDAYLASASPIGAIAAPLMFEEDEDEQDVRATEHDAYWA